MQKMFKGNNLCPFTKNVIDSPQCRQCKWFFRAGTYTFIWCQHPDEPEIVLTPNKAKTERAKQIESLRKKPTRKKATGKATATKSKGQTIGKKRGRPKKAK